VRGKVEEEGEGEIEDFEERGDWRRVDQLKRRGSGRRIRQLPDLAQRACGKKRRTSR